jgi:plastocyanin
MKKFTAVLVALLLALAACGGGGSDESTATTSASSTTEGGGGTDSPPPGGDAAVTIANFAFEVPDTVAVGTTVVVTNTDGATHTFTAEDGSFDSGRLGPDETATVTFDAAGTVDVFCQIHPSMTGSITVEG